jgi:hypothetical protein
VYVDDETFEETPDRPERCPLCGRDVPVFRDIHLVGVTPGAL